MFVLFCVFSWPPVALRLVFWTWFPVHTLEMLLLQSLLQPRFFLCPLLALSGHLEGDAQYCSQLQRKVHLCTFSSREWPRNRTGTGTWNRWNRFEERKSAMNLRNLGNFAKLDSGVNLLRWANQGWLAVPKTLEITGKWTAPLNLGNGRSTVSRVLFRRRELTEPHWVLGQTRWVLRKTRWVRLCTQIIGWEELTDFSPRNSVRAKKLTEFGVWNRTLRNRIRPVSENCLSSNYPEGLISEPRFSTPCEMRFFPREKGKMAVSKKNPRQRPFSLSRVGKIASRRG